MPFANTVDIVGDETLTNSILNRSVTEFVDNVVTSIGYAALSQCYNLTKVDTFAKSIGIMGFYGSAQLKTVILRSETMCALETTNAFTSTPIASRTGYICVPRALVDTYKAATNWSTYANQIRAIEDYTVDGTTTGALDESKI